MKKLLFLGYVVVIGGACLASAQEDALLERLRKLGKVEVLEGRMQISHYGEKSFRVSSISAAYIGEASFRLSVDFSKAEIKDGKLSLQKPFVSWYQLEEDKTRIHGDGPWVKGVTICITKDDKISFANKQMSYIDIKARDTVFGTQRVLWTDPDEKVNMIAKAQDQVVRIVRAFFAMWNSPDMEVCFM